MSQISECDGIQFKQTAETDVWKIFIEFTNNQYSLGVPRFHFPLSAATDNLKARQKLCLFKYSEYCKFFPLLKLLVQKCLENRNNLIKINKIKKNVDKDFNKWVFNLIVNIILNIIWILYFLYDIEFDINLNVTTESIIYISQLIDVYF